MSKNSKNSKNNNKNNKDNKYAYKTVSGVTTGWFNVYQGRSGYIYLQMGNSFIRLTYDQIHDLSIDCYSLIDFDYDDYIKVYSKDMGNYSNWSNVIVEEGCIVPHPTRIIFNICNWCNQPAMYTVTRTSRFSGSTYTDHACDHHANLWKQALKG